MELLCFTYLSSFFEDYSLLIAAILAFTGVTIAAILSYSSNIKTNKNNRRIEENKIRYVFNKECFSALKNASEQLKIQQMHPSAETDLAELAKKELPNYRKWYSIYDEILPFINYDKIKDVDVRKKECFTGMFNLEGQLLKDNNKFDPQYYVSLHNMLTTIRGEYIRIIDAELLELGEKLRSFKMD